MRHTNRFSDKTFLQNLGIETIRSMFSYLIRGAFHVLVRYCIFAGVLGSFWVMAVIHPEGSLPVYLVPAFLLAIPLIFLSDHHTTWEKIFSTILFLSIIGGFAGGLLYYFNLHEKHSGQVIIPAFLSLCLCGVAGYGIFRKRSRRGLNERRGGTIRLLWAIGVLYLPVLLGTIFYYRLVHNKSLESSASILFCALAFVICLTLAIMRIFWMDALRNYRAMRVGEYPSEDAVNLLELLIPRSMFLLVMVPCLLFSEAVMFSVVYRVTYLSEARRAAQIQIALRASNASKVPKASKALKNLSNPAIKKIIKPKASPESPIKQANPSMVKKPDDSYRFLAWLNFVIRPYVFPKYKNGTELNAPAWIKPFGRILLSLIILLLFTHQLNIWNLYKNCYLSLFNLVRKGAGTPDATPELDRQWREVELNIRSLLNNYGGVWRWLILFASASPTRWLRWKWLLDPGFAFLESVDRVYRYCKYNWGVAVLVGFSTLTLITLPFALIYDVYTAFLYCVLPSLIVGVALVITQRWEPLPPQIRSWLLPWLYPSHLVVSLLYFFVALSVRRTNHASLQFLWYISLATVIMYPILYWFGGERMLPADGEDSEGTTSWKNSRQVRLAFLSQFYHIEHRKWVVAALIYRIHPVRSRMMSARYVLPSLQLGLFQWLRERVKSVEDLRQRTLTSLRKGLNSHFWIVTSLFLPALLMASNNTSKDVGTVLSQVVLLLVCALLPVCTLILADMANHRWLKKSLDVYEITPKQLFGLLSALTLPSLLIVFFGFEFSTWTQRFLVFGAGYLCFFPWLGYASWHHILSLRIRRRNGEFTESKIQRPSQLGTWIELLRRKENDALSHVYQKVHMWGRTDDFARAHMCSGLVTLLESTQRSLTTERWFTEEARELERVTHLWFGEGDVVDQEYKTRPAEVLASLFQASIDAMGSILYDQTKPERRKMLAPHKAPDVAIVLRTLERILRLSQPPDFLANKQGAPPPALEEFQSTLTDLKALVLDLLKQSMNPRPSIEMRLCQKHQGELLRLLRLLDPHDYEEFQEKYSPAGFVPSSGEDSNLSLVSSTWERTETLLRLPTPIAKIYQDVHQIRQKMEQLSLTEEEIYVIPVQLHRTQEHHIFQEYRKTWGITHELSLQRQNLWKRQRHLYQELLGYILAGLKTNLPFQPEYTGWLNLHWDTPEAREYTDTWLTETSLDIPEVTYWSDLYRRAYDRELSETLSRVSVDEHDQDYYLEQLELILESLAPFLSEAIKLQWYQDIQIPKTGGDFEEVTIHVDFHSANPRIEFVEDPAYHYNISPLLTNSALLWTGKQPHEFRRLEIWIARWLLDLLWQASRSWEIWVPHDETEDPIEYRQDNLYELEQLLQQLGELLPMPSREDQETIDRWFRRIDRRIALLYRNIDKPVDETPLETSLSYQSLVQTVQSKLHEMQILGEMRMAQLIHAGLLPHCSFQYLSDVIFAENETLLHYKYGNGTHGTVQPIPYQPSSSELHDSWLYYNQVPDAQEGTGANGTNGPHGSNGSHDSDQEQYESFDGFEHNNDDFDPDYDDYETNSSEKWLTHPDKN